MAQTALVRQDDPRVVPFPVKKKQAKRTNSGGWFKRNDSPIWWFRVMVKGKRTAHSTELTDAIVAKLEVGTLATAASR